MLRDLGQGNSLLNQFVAEIRSVDIQSDRMRFRRNLERIGELIGFELSKELKYEAQQVRTPLGAKTQQLLAEQPILATILRAGLPLHQGLLNLFDGADNAFISAYRRHLSDGSFNIKLEYLSCPVLDGRVLIVSDPMLATGASMVQTLEELLKEGTPSAIHLVAAIASRPGIEKVRNSLSNVTVWAAAVDEELDSRGYIVPGLGDAGDLAYGAKVQA